MTLANSPTLESAMLALARKASSDVRNGDLLGLGSGSAVSIFAKVLGERVRQEKLRVTVVPSSLQARGLAIENGLVIASDSAHCPQVMDIAIDGADQVASETRSMIKGGGGQLLKEKIILSVSKRVLILVQKAKVFKRLNRPIPVEVVQFALGTVAESLRSSLEADSELRKLEKGYPYYTESGNVILDVAFKQEILNPKSLEIALKSIPGVVEAGIFNCKVDEFLVGNQDGSVEVF